MYTGPELRAAQVMRRIALPAEEMVTVLEELMVRALQVPARKSLQVTGFGRYASMQFET